MTTRFLVLLVFLGAFVLSASSAALWAGVQDARLASSGPRQDLPVEEITPDTCGWVAIAGCVRHDLAVGVTSGGRVYALGSAPVESEESDRVFTPLSARDDCDEERTPRRLYALVEDDDALTNTIGHAYRARVAPPPVLAVVEGVTGFGAGHLRLARSARGGLSARGLSAGALPLVVKGARPGLRWVALVTVGAGVHGVLLFGLGALWLVRRSRRRHALATGQVVEAEEDFFRTETLD